MTVKPHEDFDQEAVQKIRDAMIPRLLIVMGCGAVVMLLGALVAFRSVLLTVPLMAMLGIWMILNAYRIMAAQKGSFVLRGSSPIRRAMTLVLLVGGGPLLLVAAGFAIDSDPEGTIRVLTLIYNVIALPLIAYTFQQVRSLVGGSSK